MTKIRTKWCVNPLPEFMNGDDLMLDAKGGAIRCPLYAGASSGIMWVFGGGGGLGGPAGGVYECPGRAGSAGGHHVAAGKLPESGGFAIIRRRYVPFIDFDRKYCRQTYKQRTKR
jgi:hypothetical protein